MNSYLRAKKLSDIILSKFELNIDAAFGPDLFKIEAKEDTFSATFFAGHKEIEVEGPGTFYSAVGGHVSINSRADTRFIDVNVTLTTEQLNVLKLRYSNWFTPLLEGDADFNAKCEAIYPKWAVLPVLKRNPKSYQLTLTFNNEPSQKVIDAITHLMVYVGYPVNKMDKDEPEGVARQRYLSNISAAA